MKALITASCIGLLGLFPLSALAANEHDAHAGHTLSKAPVESPLSEGIVKKVDKASGKITITHGPLLNLDMPAMTMVFVVKDKAMLDKLKTGDKVKFKVVNDGGKFTVTEIQPAP